MTAELLLAAATTAVRKLAGPRAVPEKWIRAVVDASSRLRRAEEAGADVEDLQSELRSEVERHQNTVGEQLKQSLEASQKKVRDIEAAAEVRPTHNLDAAYYRAKDEEERVKSLQLMLRRLLETYGPRVG